MSTQNDMSSIPRTQSIRAASIHNICWRAQWVNKYESLWSLIRKFAILNFASARDVKGIFARDRTEQPRSKPSCRFDGDLRFFGSLDPVRLARVLNLSESVLREALVDYYVKRREALHVSADVLRFCPACLKNGFHSAMYQLLFVKNCPLHGDSLRSHCQACSLRHVPYTLSSAVNAGSAGCCQCLGSWAGYSLESSYLNASRNHQALAYLSNWLGLRTKLAAIDQPLELWLGADSSAKWNQRRLQHLPRYWADALGSRLPDFLFSRSKPVIHVVRKLCTEPNRVQRTAQTRESALRDSGNQKWGFELFGIYKSVRRYLMRTRLFLHATCIARVCRHGWLDQLMADGKICAPANAFVLWRMYFEGVPKPNSLITRYRGYNSRHGRPVRIHWQPPIVSLPQKVLQHLFVRECLAAFEECWLLALAHKRKNCHSFLTGNLKRRRMPYWMYEQQNGKDVLHIWTMPAVGARAYMPVTSHCEYGPWNLRLDSRMQNSRTTC
jgi:hypothetical protein